MLAVDGSRKSRLTEVLTSRPILSRDDAGVEQGLFAGQGGGVGGQRFAVPHAPRMDAGDVAEHVGADAEAVHGRLELGVDLGRTQRVRRIDMGEAGDGDVLEQHGM